MKISGVEELPVFAEEFLATLAPGPSARVVTLSGDLGAGKTAFTQESARLLGVTERVTSPTFVIENIYALTGKPWKRLIHIDAYRLNGAGELLKLGWEGIMTDPENIIFLEWPERVQGIIPEDAIKLRFDIDGEGRIITRT